MSMRRDLSVSESDRVLRMRWREALIIIIFLESKLNLELPFSSSLGSRAHRLSTGAMRVLLALLAAGVGRALRTGKMVKKSSEPWVFAQRAAASL